VGADERVRENRHSDTDDRRWIDARLRTTSLRQRERRRKQLKNLGESDVGIGDLEKCHLRSSGKRRGAIGADDHRAGAAAIQIFSVAGVGKKSDFTGRRFIYRCNSANRHVTIADHLPVDEARQCG